MFKNALVSTSNKAGLAEFLKPLVAKGLRVVSTGGTSAYLRDHGIPVVEVAEQTGFPEVMDGRVRTLHPSIHMPLLSRLGNAEDDELLVQNKLIPFDLVVVNLYPFAEALKKGLRGDELIEFIDIGGPSLLRGAAKNHSRVTVVCDPQDYSWISARATEGRSLELYERQKLAAKVFLQTSRYDSLIAQTLDPENTQAVSLGGDLVQELRYGENAQQKAWWFQNQGATSGLHESQILHGKTLSYNNLLDLEASCRAVADFEEPCAIAVKHNSPCGVGTGASVYEAVLRALTADPVSVFGGIVAINRTVDASAAQALSKIFLECVVAPAFDEEALRILKNKKDLRILAWPQLTLRRNEPEFRTVAGGYLLQTPDSAAQDLLSFPEPEPPLGLSPESRRDMLTAWKTCAHLKSNAIAIVCDGMSIGLGMGQVNRVDAVEQAIERMQKHHSSLAPRAVLASDAFFPFPDSIELIAEAGVKWIVQPGGSIRDEAVLTRARELGVSMVLTQTRHFRH
jgi:phosphoribosylaminoimidazolecarboxamide formyltransferase/IMP cyclohydrolase